MSKAFDDAFALINGKKITQETVEKLQTLQAKIEPQEQDDFAQIMEGANLAIEQV